MYVKKELTFDDMSDFLWSGARDRWQDATDEQRQAVWDMLEDVFYEEIPDETTVNDFVWFDCDDIFSTEEAEEYDESLKRNNINRNKLESRIKRLEKLLSKRK